MKLYVYDIEYSQTDKVTVVIESGSPGDVVRKFVMNNWPNGRYYNLIRQTDAPLRRIA